jgi:hypothetical protein
MRDRCRGTNIGNYMVVPVTGAFTISPDLLPIVWSRRRLARR